MQRVHGAGAMVSAEAAADEVGDLAGVVVAAVNGPRTTVLSGDPAAIAAAVTTLQQRGVACRMLEVPYAFHSPQMEALQQDFAAAIDGLAPMQPIVPIVSTLTGEGAGFDVAYWVRQMREPVRFADAIAALAGGGHDVFVEIGAHPVLGRALNECAAGGTVLASLRRNRSDRDTLLDSVGRLYTLGYDILWEQIYPSGNCVPLPAYPWQHSRYWIEDGAAIPKGLLGARLRSPGLAGDVYESRLNETTVSFAADHRVLGATVLPATAYIELALAASPKRPRCATS